MQEQMMTPTLDRRRLESQLCEIAPRANNANQSSPLIDRADPNVDPNPRICICLDYLFPKDCQECNLPTRYHVPATDRSSVPTMAASRLFIGCVLSTIFPAQTWTKMKSMPTSAWSVYVTQSFIQTSQTLLSTCYEE